jgi:histone arginine demethylase JMJD6
VIVKDALANWTAMEVFSYEFFRELYTKESSSPRSQRCQFFPYKTGFRSLIEALTMSKERQLTPWYFGWSNCDSETADILRNHYSRPYFLPERSESSRTDWIFMGTAGLGAHMHVRTFVNGESGSRMLLAFVIRFYLSDPLSHFLILFFLFFFYFFFGDLKVDHVSLASWQAQIRGKKSWSLEPPPECFYQCRTMEVIVEPGDTSRFLTCYKFISSIK